MWWIVMAGAMGGILRGVLGIAKDLALKKEETINWGWLLISVLISAILGAVVATFFNGEGVMALLGGYSGADFVEGLMKIKLKRIEEDKIVKETKNAEKSRMGTLTGYLKREN
jgi:uncharacterized membrane protein HdeD (DUF308 family)